MSNVHQINQQAESEQSNSADDDESLNEASNWIAKLDRGLTVQEESALKDWLAQTPKHIEVLLEMAKLWDKMEGLSCLSDLFLPPATVRGKKIPLWFGTIAASVVVAFSLILFDFNLTSFGQTEPISVTAKSLDFNTHVGETSTINLPDNSKINLNTNSVIAVTYTDSARVIDLRQGEIHVDVVADKNRPLTVIASNRVIQALGTTFNVEVRNELVELIVTDGDVLVADTALLSSTDNARDVSIERMTKRLSSSDSMAISKGEKINLDVTGKTTEVITKVDPLDMAVSLSWRQGNLIFRGEPLVNVMSEISRYTNIEFELSDDEMLHKIQVAGMFKIGDVKGLLDVLSSNFNISYEKEADNRFILSYAG